jgi:hypothetical protein
MKETKQSHELVHSDRTDYFKKLDKQLNDMISLNKELASRYRYLKYDLYDLKLKMIDKLEERLAAFVSVKDKREVKLVQEKMHFALKDYFKYKSWC